MSTHVDTTIVSLSLLIFIITFLLSWLTLRTLKEGRKALKEINKDSY